MDKQKEAGVEKTTQEAPLETEVNESGASADKQGEEVNWEEVAKKERERAENYKKAFTQKRQFVKAAQEEVAETEEDEDKPLTRRDLQKVLRETVTPVFAENKVESTLKDLVKDPAKREAVKAIYENRIRQTGTSDEAIRQDIEAALDLADAHKLKKENAELTRKSNMQTQTSLSGSSSDRGSDIKTHKFSDTQIAELTARAKSTGQDPAKFIEQVWKNQNKG